MNEVPLIPEGIRRQFLEGFRVGDIAAPLASFDDCAPSADVLKFLKANDFDAIGIRRAGRMAGYVERSELRGGNCGEFLKEFEPAMVLGESSPLIQAVGLLSGSPRLFITAFSEVAGIVTRHDFEKAPARMWLFGMVTMIEMRYSRLIAEECPNESWRQYLSPARVAKSESLLSLRRQHRRNLGLLDCLQLADKGQIVARCEPIRRQTIFTSRSQAEAGIKLLERLRNDLAHAQDIVDDNWEAIELLSGSLERLSNGSPKLFESEIRGEQKQRG